MNSEENKAEAVDFFAPRTVVLINNLNTRNKETGEIERKEVEFVHKTIRLTNEIWLEFNRILNPRRTFQNGKLTYIEDLAAAVSRIYKQLVPEVPEGYAPYFREALTLENFCDLIPQADKEAVLDRVFAFEINETEKEFFFGESDGATFEVDVPINGKVATGTIGLLPETKAAEKSYKKATEPSGNDIRRFRSPEVSVKPDYKKLSELFGSLKSFAGNFQNDEVPIWCQVGLVRYYFDEFGKSNAKN